MNPIIDRAVATGRAIQPPMRGPRPRRWLVISGAAVCTLLIAAVLGLFVLYPYLGARAIRAKLVGKLADRTGQEVAVGDIDVSLGRAVLSDLTITDDRGQVILAIDSVEVRFGVLASLFGQVSLESAAVNKPRALIVRAADGSSPWDRTLEWLRSRQSGGDGEGGGGVSLVPPRATIAGGSFELRDLGRGITAVAGGLSGEFVRGESLSLAATDVSLMSRIGPRAEIAELTLAGEPHDLAATAEIGVSGGALTLWEGMSLTGVAGTIAPGPSDGQLSIDLGGGWGNSKARLWTAKGHVAPATRVGRVEVAAERFTLDKLADVLEGSPLRDYAKTSLDAELIIKSDGSSVSAAGSIDVAGLSVFHTKLAAETVGGVAFDGEIAATYDSGARTARLEKAVLRSGGVEYQLSADVRLGVERRFDKIAARLIIPAVDCQAMLDGLPDKLVPRLQGFELSGTFTTDIDLLIDWDDLEETALGGSVGIRKCRVRKPAPGMSARKIRKEFKHQVLVGRDDGEDIYRTMTIGPSADSFVPLEMVSPYLVKSFMTTEDSSFFRHRGFIVSEFRTALIKNLEAGRFRYGASSITMQLVKNVYLDRQKTLSRKLEELFMTWYIETQVDKNRLMEVYVNAIEYGPALYGIGPAARRYFGKHPIDLNPREAAFFSSILPSPRRRFRQFCRGKLDRWAERKVGNILAKMHERERLTDEEFEQVQRVPLVFSSEKVGCGRRRFR
jgi:hypothetical protein